MTTPGPFAVIIAYDGAGRWREIHTLGVSESDAARVVARLLVWGINCYKTCKVPPESGGRTRWPFQERIDNVRPLPVREAR